MDVLVFDLYGDWGHFRRYFTTTSPLSFAVPPRTTLTGVLGALLHIKRGTGDNEFPLALNQRRARIAVAPLTPLATTNLGLKLISTKAEHLVKGAKKLFGPHYVKSPYRYEFLRRPAYRLFVNLTDTDLMGRLEETLDNHHTGFTLSLGLSELLANYRYLGRKRAVEVKSTEPVELHSAVTEASLGRGNEPAHIRGARWVKYISAIEMNPDREVTCYEPVFSMVSHLNHRKRLPDTLEPPLVPQIPPLKCQPGVYWEVELPEVGVQRFCFLERSDNGGG